LLEKLKSDIAASVESAAQKEGARLRAQGKLNEAVALLESIYSIFPQVGIRDHLCVFYCDGAGEFMKARRYPEARAQFLKALKLNPSHQRARTDMGTAYNNEAIDQKSPDKAIPLLEKALEYDPESTVVKQNLARAYNERAVELMNAASPDSGTGPLDQAIEILKKAVRLQDPNLTDEDIQARTEQNDADEIGNMGGSAAGDPFKAVLSTLALALSQRWRPKAAKLNSDAEKMLKTVSTDDRSKGVSVCDQAIKMLIEAVRVLRPRISDRCADLASVDALLRSVDDQLVRAILKNLSAAYRMRKTLRGEK
jgi:tetratricopeptide (TPR) repeat protein